MDQQRAIDGRLVVTAKAAKAVVTFDESGDITWARSLEDSQGIPPALHPVRSVATKDAALLVLAQADIPPLRLVKLTQSGNVLWSRTFEVPDAIQCGVKPVAVVDDRDVRVSASVGIAVYPEDGHSAEELLRSADTAMYAAKRVTTGPVLFSQLGE